MSAFPSIVPESQMAGRSGETRILVSLAVATIALHWFAAAHTPGFFRDELQTLDDARHLSWGYVAYPPMAPFFGRLSLILFGISVPGFDFLRRWSARLRSC